MASGSIELSSSKAWEGRIDWSSSTDIANNCSYVYVYAAMWKTDGYLTSSNSYTSGTITINGSSYSLTGYQEFKNEVCIFEDYFTIYHNSDGSKSFTISLSCKGQANTSLSGVTLSGSGTATMDLIPRTSSFAATDAAIGSVSTITIYRESPNLYHRVKVKFGSVSGYVTNSGGFSTSAATITGTSVAFTIPNDFYYAIPNAQEGTCELTLYTLSGGSIIGDEVTTEIAITTVSTRCNPTLTLSVSHDNSDTASLTGSNSAFIRGYSDADCNVSATARYGATITKIWANEAFTDNGNGSYTIAPVNSDTITFYAQDSRGYTGSVSVKVTLVPYIVLTNNAVGGRPKPTDGSAFIQFKGDYFAGSFGAVNNTLSIQYYIEYPDGTKTSVRTVTPTISDNAYSAYIEMTGFDYTKVYGVHVTVRDKLREVYKYAVIKQGIPVFDWGRDDFQFNVPVYMSDHPIHGLPTPEADDEPATVGYVKELLGIDSGGGSGSGSGSGTTSSALFTESTSYPGCFYRTASDGSTEWLNPPMVAGVVYRTLARYNGKPVYTVFLSITMPSPETYNGWFYWEIPFSVSGFGSSRLVDATIKLDGTQLPIMMSGGAYVGVELITSSYIYVNCSGVNYSANTCQVVLRFTTS